MLAPGAAVAAPAEYSNLVDKVVFFHDGLLFATNCKYTMSGTSNTNYEVYFPHTGAAAA